VESPSLGVFKERLDVMLGLVVGGRLHQRRSFGGPFQPL